MVKFPNFCFLKISIRLINVLIQEMRSLKTAPEGAVFLPRIFLVESFKALKRVVYP